MSREMDSRQRGVDKTLHALLEHMTKIGATQMVLTSGSRVMFRVSGESYPARVELASEQLRSMLTSIMSASQAAKFASQFEVELRLAYTFGHFRISAFAHGGQPGMVVRALCTQPPTLEQLQLSERVAAQWLAGRGLVLCTGQTAPIRAAAIAALTDHRNASSPGHIVTVEDPIEFVYGHKQCVVTQREVGLDTGSSVEALNNARRQAPDLVVVNELRDAQTMAAALALVEGGALCIVGLAASSLQDGLRQALRLVDGADEAGARARLCRSLCGALHRQPLGGKSQEVVAFELLLATARVRSLIARGDLERLAEVMEDESAAGCRSLESTLFELVRGRQLTAERALELSPRPEALRRLFRGRVRAVTDPGNAASAPLRLAADPYARAAGLASTQLRDGDSTRRSGTMRVPVQQARGRQGVPRVGNG